MSAPEGGEPPPPPYSETDIYSSRNSGGRPSPHRPSSSACDSSAHSLPAASIASSQSDVIYTPPLTPRNASAHDTAFFASSSSSRAAEAYFESRPLPPAFFQDQHVTHNLTANPSSRPDDFPYVDEWSSRDIAPQDWQTFLNFLFPAHAATSNETIVDRKLRAEEESIAGTEPSSSSRQSHASAQLGQLRSAQVEVEVATSTAEARREATAVVSEWNHGFFQPRAVWIRLVYQLPAPAHETQQTLIPGSWAQPGFDHLQAPQQPHSGPYQPPPHPPSCFVAHQPYPWGGPSYHPPPKQPGFSFAGIRMNDDGLYIGSSVAADRRGLRLGDLVADNNGLRFRDNVFVGPGMFGGGPNREYPGTAYRAASSYHPPPGFPMQPPFIQPPLHQDARPPLSRGFSEPHPFPQQQQQQWRRSPSVSSTSSRSKDSTSTSSIGSQPDHDDIGAGQIPGFRAQLRAWLAQPERHVTSRDVQRLKAELGEARRTQAELPRANVDEVLLEAEIKGLTQEWRALKRLHRNQQRERKRERRARRRLEKKARKEADKGRGHTRGTGSWGAPNGPSPGFLPPLAPPGPWGYGGPTTGGPPFGYAPGFGAGAAAGFHGTSLPPQVPGACSPDTNQKGGQSQRPPWDHQGEARDAPAEALHEASQAKFRQLDELEKELTRKYTRLYDNREEEKQEEMVSGQQHSIAGPGGLEAEVENLTRQVERLRMEADEAFARELEQQERRAG